MEHYDVIIVGAGLSGIGAARHLQIHSPKKTYAILEGRERMGGTWDLFRYPGIRSDSDMHTLGYVFKPWTERKAIADGPSILKYIKDTASENGIEPHVQYGMQVKKSSWSTEEGKWTVEAANGSVLTCGFLFMCSGYYDYAEGYIPEFEDLNQYQGQIVHPQSWPEDLDYANKRILVIGSGATAVTLVPSMADKAAHVIMLQRSPTYMVSRPATDTLANALRKFLPDRWAYSLTRWKNVLLGMYFFNYSRKNPKKVAEMLIDGVREQLNNDFDVDKHFTPSYKPWDQRLCLVPDGDMFEAINDKKVSIVTDHIDKFTTSGVLLKSGATIDADIVVMATGLKLQVMSGLQITVDGKKMQLADALTYKGMMFSNIPNLALSMGYTNASWTLKSDLTAAYVCRLLNYMDYQEYSQCCPRVGSAKLTLKPFMDLKSGYVLRLIDKFPKQAEEKPWRLNQNYAKDMLALGFGSIRDDAIEFRRLPVATSDEGATSDMESVA